MKIIKNNYKPKEFTVICDYCKSELLLNIYDVSKHNKYEFEFTCPCCKNLLIKDIKQYNLSKDEILSHSELEEYWILHQ